MKSDVSSSPRPKKNPLQQYISIDSYENQEEGDKLVISNNFNVKQVVDLNVSLNGEAMPILYPSSPSYVEDTTNRKDEKLTEVLESDISNVNVQKAEI